MITAAALGLALAGCSARRGPAVGRVPALDSASERHGQRVFMEFCNQCHPGGDAGLAPALNNKPAPAAAIKLQVREGLGRMPAFPERVLDDRALDDLVAYIEALRRAE